MRRKDLLHGKDEVAAVGVNGQAQLTLTQPEDRIADFYVLRITQLDERVGSSHRPSFAYGQVILLGEVVKRDLVGLTDGLGKLIGDVGSLLIGLGEEQR